MDKKSIPDPRRMSNEALLDYLEEAQCDLDFYDSQLHRIEKLAVTLRHKLTENGERFHALLTEAKRRGNSL